MLPRFSKSNSYGIQSIQHVLVDILRVRTIFGMAATESLSALAFISQRRLGCSRSDGAVRMGAVAAQFANTLAFDAPGGRGSMLHSNDSVRTWNYAVFRNILDTQHLFARIAARSAGWGEVGARNARTVR